MTDHHHRFSSGLYILVDRKPVAVDWDEYAAWMLAHKYQPRKVNYKNNPDDLTRVGWTEIGDAQISTVFLGLDHGWGDGRPILFETRVLRGPLKGECEQYRTWDEAEVGHHAMCERVKQAQSMATRRQRGQQVRHTKEAV